MSILSQIPVIAAAVGLSSAEAETPADIRFEVYRNNSRMGEHAVAFSRTEAGDLRVDVDIDLAVRLGPIPVFRYQHDATEYWRDGQLIAIQAATFSDGEWSRWQAALNDTDGVPLAELPPSSHWTRYDPATVAILNTETGEAMPVEIVSLGLEAFPTSAGSVQAERIRMTGTLTVDLWYDADGNWVGCEFEARGQRIRYVRVG
ncbi:DUF6134 family protein [Maricaulis sp.]|uniref:DUF6134 family protein n=1 Tax=unclassified Maricaulis TaxID=2632371 RepID=UPI001B2D9D31|nr:DUF6134 family protein [Maricaulis sp.]MBO6797908.1 hypothetical protein [Maricaulis sp.]